MRFQPANSADLEAYSLRLELLAKDAAHIAVPLLRAACDRAAITARGLPYVSEILAHASDIVAERQRAVEAAHHFEQSRTGRALLSPGEQSMRQANLDLIQRGHRARWAMTPGGRYELFDVSGSSAVHRCNGDGTVEALVWSTKERDYVTQAYFDRQNAA